MTVATAIRTYDSIHFSRLNMRQVLNDHFESAGITDRRERRTAVREMMSKIDFEWGQAWQAMFNAICADLDRISIENDADELVGSAIKQEFANGRGGSHVDKIIDMYRQNI